MPANGSIIVIRPFTPHPLCTEVVENKGVQAFWWTPSRCFAPDIVFVSFRRGDKGTKNVYPDCLSCAISSSCFSPAAHQQLFPTLCRRPFAVRSPTAQSSHGDRQKDKKRLMCLCSTSCTLTSPKVFTMRKSNNKMCWMN